MNKTKNKKQIIGLLASLKHNNFGIICHTVELGFLLSFIHRKCWTLFLDHNCESLCVFVCPCFSMVFFLCSNVIMKIIAFVTWNKQMKVENT
jgi:hypothetical protein